ncbi:MAG: HlyD family secretion protein [Burkholderiaceae bacterium]|nr:HlyD family secretion protein [Burkholderiaceae bacterium]
MRLRTSWLLVGALALGSALWLARDQVQGSEAVAFRTAALERGPIVASVSATGTIAPVASIQIGSQVSGQIVELLADFNSEVRAGQLLARIDPQTFEQRVRQAEADLEAARAQVMVQRSQVSARKAEQAKMRAGLADARRDLKRKEDLVAHRFVTTAERDRVATLVTTLEYEERSAAVAVEVALAMVRSAEAQVRQRQASLAGARIDLQRTSIQSPVDGVVIKRSVDAGQTVAASLQSPELFVIARNLADMQVECNIDESDIGRVRTGQEASFTVDAFPGTTLKGRVDQVRKAANNVQNVITYIAVVRFANTAQLMLPGMTANVRIETERREKVLRVANAALRFRPPAGVRVVEAPGSRAEVRPSPTAPAAASPSERRRLFTERLTRELTLTPAQQSRLETVFDSMRPRYLELRSAPPADRERLLRTIRTETGARIAAMLDERQATRYREIAAEMAGRNGGGGGRGRIYLSEDAQVRALEVRTGISDGTFTEVTAAGLAEGAKAIIAMRSVKPAAGFRMPRL